MRIIAGLLCASATVFAAPAFAQAGGDSGSALETSNALNFGAEGQASENTTNFSFSPGFAFLDKLTVNSGMEQLAPSLAPIEKDQLGLSWRAGGKWGITLDLTSRTPNEVLPREEIAAGAYYQITPRFRFGGGVSVGGSELSSAGREGFRTEELDTGVRLESAFSF